MSIYKGSESPYSKIDWLSTGFSNLDRILGGGVPSRKLLEISGVFSVGKSTLALQIVAQAQKAGMDCLWCDSEFSFGEEYAQALGVNTKKLDVLTARFAEDVLDGIEEWANEHKDALIVLDSVGALLPRQESEKNSGEKVIGGQARLIATFTRKIIPILAINNISLIVLNHNFTDILSGAIKTSGGEKLAYSKSVWLMLRKASKRVMQGENQVGEIIEASIRKNKLAPTNKQSCDLTMLYGQGFSVEADLLQDLLDSGEVTKVKNKYFRGETLLGVGQAKAREALKTI